MPIGAASSSSTSRSTKQYQCSICGKSFDSAEILDSHKRLEHSESGQSKPPAGVG